MSFQARKIYLASSWRNQLQPQVLATLRAWGHEVYDFRNPEPGDYGFSWREIDPEWRNWTPEQFVAGLTHPVAQHGFGLDFFAMKWADTCVLLLPCGRSAHLEAGYFTGANRDLFIYAPELPEPELMYLMATRICTNLIELLDAIGSKED